MTSYNVIYHSIDCFLANVVVNKCTWPGKKKKKRCAWFLFKKSCVTYLLWMPSHSMCCLWATSGCFFTKSASVGNKNSQPRLTRGAATCSRNSFTSSGGSCRQTKEKGSRLVARHWSCSEQSTHHRTVSCSHLDDGRNLLPHHGALQREPPHLQREKENENMPTMQHETKPSATEISNNSPQSHGLDTALQQGRRCEDCRCFSDTGRHCVWKKQQQQNK